MNSVMHIYHTIDQKENQKETCRQNQLTGAMVSSPCWLVLPGGFFLVLFLICSMVNMHNKIHPIQSRINLMPNGGASNRFLAPVGWFCL